MEDVVFSVDLETLLPVAQLEPGPENPFRQFAGSQWAKSVSHQPYWEPDGRYW